MLSEGSLCQQDMELAGLHIDIHVTYSRRNADVKELH
jgi:hypothetical protein